jgi:hypothetical protein
MATAKNNEKTLSPVAVQPEKIPKEPANKRTPTPAVVLPSKKRYHNADNETKISIRSKTKLSN